MNLFRSEEHARRWEGYTETMVASLKPVDEWADIFSGAVFRERGRRDYMSWLHSEEGQAAWRALRELLPRRAE